MNSPSMPIDWLLKPCPILISRVSSSMIRSWNWALHRTVSRAGNCESIIYRDTPPDIWSSRKPATRPSSWAISFRLSPRFSLTPRDGHLATYIQSLRLLESITEGYLYPGHGSPAPEGRLVVSRTLRHRQKREQRLLEALDHSPRTIDEILPKVYVKIDRNVVKYAQRSLLSGLIKLVEEERVKETSEGYRLV